MRFSMISLGALMLATATPAFAQEETSPPEPVTISGGATVVSDYRFRGFSQTNEEATIQGTFTISHESGLYVGTWGSGIGFANGTEIDLYGGYSTDITDGVGIDVGATVYLYPGASNSTIIEPYAKLKTSIGPASLTTGIAWAPGGQDSLGGDSGVYVSGDLGLSVPGTPLSVTGHAGWAKSDSFLGGLDGEVFDYSIGVSASWKALTLGVAYVNTDETTTGGWKEGIGADGAAIFSLSAAF
ncbi:MAG: TorF family putative porin [Pseudomonadota bacterium]